MEFNEIMQNITSGLKGEFQEDFVYLQEQMENYKEHPLGKEIVRACGRIIAEIMPEDMKAEINKAMHNNLDAYKQSLEEVKFNIYKKDYEKALAIIEPLVKEFDEGGMFQNDSESEYYTFDVPFEGLMYECMENPTRTVRKADFPYSETYFIYGSLLFECQRYDEAAVSLDKAKRWNPMSASIGFERAEIEKVKGNLQEFFDRTKLIFKYAFEPDAVAHCYRNFAYYFVERKAWNVAKACLIMSLQYEHENKNALSELYYIDNSADRVLKELTGDEMVQLLKENGVDVTVTNNVLGLAYSLGNHFMGKAIYDGAFDMFKIVYDLTEDEGIMKIMESIKEKYLQDNLKH